MCDLPAPPKTPPELVQNSDDPCIEEELKGSEDVQCEPIGETFWGLDIRRMAERSAWIPVMLSSQGTNGEYSMAYL